jgi:hypothetical protein
MSYIGNAPTTTAFLTDTFSGNASTTAFTMSVAPAGTTSMLVAITGVVQDPSTYSVVGTTLTFSAAPPTGTNNISVRYLGIPASGVTTTAYRTVTNFTATSGQTTFSVPSYTVGYINVYRNGVRLADADYTATNGITVVLTNAATLNDSVVTESFYVSSVLNAIPAAAGAVNSTYITDSAVTTAKIADANVTQAKLAANVAGNGPAFSAYKGTGQSITNGAYTKVTFTTEEYDTNSNYDAPNSKFQPTVAGHYLVTAQAGYSTGAALEQAFMVFKNGSSSKRLADIITPDGRAIGGAALLYMNGSTDYIEMYLYTSVTMTIVGNSEATYFQAFLARAA